MARITVEDCLERIPNLFELVLTASKRSRRLANGEAMVEWENDKPTVVALREIAEGHVNADILQESEQQQLLESVFEDDSEAKTEEGEQPQPPRETQIIPPTATPLE